MKKILLTILLFSTFLFSEDINIKNFFNKNKCDLIINKNDFLLCYDYNAKATKQVAFTIKKNQITNNELEEEFYIFDDQIHKEYQPTNTYENKYINLRLVPYFAFNYDEETINNISMISNIRPIKKKIYKRWIKLEDYFLLMVNKFDKIDFLVGTTYSKNSKRINTSLIPDTYWVIMYDNKSEYQECFSFKNTNNIIEEDYSLKKSKIDCDLLIN